jgi:hypothetical protein
MTPSGWSAARPIWATVANIKSEARETTTDFFMVLSFLGNSLLR